MVTFVVTGDGTVCFQTVNFDLFKPEKEKLFVLISITLNADGIAQINFVC